MSLTYVPHIDLQTLLHAFTVSDLIAPALDPELVRQFLASLPRLKESDLDVDGACPICLVRFRDILAEEETGLAMDSPAYAQERLGVIRLDNTCQHIFCRSDIMTWLSRARNSCPTCRRPLFETNVAPAAAQVPQQEPTNQDVEVAPQTIPIHTIPGAV